MNRESKFECPHCDQHLLCGAELAGREINCPGCGQALVLPALQYQVPSLNLESAEGIEPPAFRSQRLRRVFYSAMLGALAMSVAGRFHLLFGVLLGDGLAERSWGRVLLQLIGTVVWGALLSPWGWAGGVMGWIWSDRRSLFRTARPTGPEGNTNDVTEPAEGLLLRGEGPMACAMGLAVVAACAAPQVMLGVSALVLVPVVLAFILLGLLRARSRTTSVVGQALGFLLLGFALNGWMFSTHGTVENSAREARLAQLKPRIIAQALLAQSQENEQQSQLLGLPRPPVPTADDPAVKTRVEMELKRLPGHLGNSPAPLHWIHGAVQCLAAVAMALGLRCWAAWSPLRCLFWGGVVFAFPQAMAWMIRALGPWMALSA